LAAAAILAWLCTDGDLRARSVDEVAVSGTVTDESGAPVPVNTVRLLKARTFLNLRNFSTRSQDVEEMRATTDAHGFFEFRFPVDSQFRFYYLRFYDPNGFDTVKFRLPADKEISRRTRQGRPVHTDVVLQFQEDWPAVKGQVEQYGPGSPCGQVLRALGLPTRKVSQDGGREVWQYETAGVSYLVEGSRVLETRRMAKAAVEAVVPGSSKDAAVPAQRTDRP
jgi:hypothetical protein